MADLRYTTYLQCYQDYLRHKIMDPVQFHTVVQLAQTCQPGESLGCKALIRVVELTGQFNFSIKVWAEPHVTHVPFDEAKGDCLQVLCVLSDESTTAMVEHWQAVFIMTVTAQQIQYSEVQRLTINQYDPIMSKSRDHQGQYQYSPVAPSLSRQIIVTRIDEDQLASLPDSFQDYYHQKYLPMDRSSRYAELKMVCPFLSNQAFEVIARSLRKLRHLLYAKAVLDHWLRHLLVTGDRALYQIFTRLDQADLTQLEQSDCFLRLVCGTDQGLTYDEWLDLMVERIKLQTGSGRLADLFTLTFSEDGQKI